MSHNAARLLTSFFGVSAWGRVLVPVNFRLAADEVRYIVEHSGARVMLVDDLIHSKTPCMAQLAEAHATTGGNVLPVMEVPAEHTARYERQYRLYRGLYPTLRGEMR